MEELKPCPFCGDKPQITTEKCLTSLEFHKGYLDNGGLNGNRRKQKC